MKITNKKVSTGELTLKIMKSAGWYNNWLFSFIKSFCYGSILEVGAGIGNFTSLLTNCGKVTAIDYDKKYIRKLKEKNKAIAVGFGDVEQANYFFKKGKFDTLVCLNVLEHIKEDKKALKNMYSLLSNKGRLVLLVPAHMFLFSKFDTNLGHFRRYDKKNLQCLLSKIGFKKVNSRYLNWWAAVGWFVFLKLTGKESLPKDKVKIFDKMGKYLIWPEKFLEFPFGLSVLAIAQK